MISLYTADYVVTQNDARDIIENAAVAVQDGRILSVGHTDLLEILFPEHRRVDMGLSAGEKQLVSFGHHAGSHQCAHAYSHEPAARVFR